MRTDSFEAAETVSNRILGVNSFPDVFELIHVGRDDFEATVDVWRQYRDHDLSFTDANSVALCERYDIDTVLSFDSDFDGLVDRRGPTRV
jgi:predicted nucleic acid-binding protein